MLTVVLFSIIPCLLFFVVPNTYALFKNVSSDALFQLKNEVQMLDFRSEYDREIFGYISGSILVPQGLNEDEIENFIESNIKENIPLVVISDYQDDAAIPENIVIDSKNYYYLGNIKAWIQSGGKIEYPKIINYQALYDSIVGDISTIPVILIDVRSPIEISTQKSLPTAHNIPISKIEKAFQKSNQEFKIDHGFEKPSKDYPNVILTCRSGRRAKFADVLLKKLGYNKLRIYEGSYLDWTANDGPLV